MANESELLRITYVKSCIGYSQRQKDTIRTLGLRRLGDSVLQADNPAVRGMVHAVRHLVAVEAVGDLAVTAGQAGDGMETGGDHEAP
jgi:large subunit ribosomal protein L30